MVIGVRLRAPTSVDVLLKGVGQMLWVWIIVAIIIIALIIWFLMRARDSKGAGANGQVGRHASPDDGAKHDATGAAGAQAAPTSAVPVADPDQQAAAGEPPRSADAPVDTHGAMNSDDVADDAPDDAADRAPDDAHDAPTTAMPVAGQSETGTNGDSALPADGSDEFNDVHDAVDTAHSPTGEAGPGSDAQVAEKNDEVAPRRADAPTQAPAEATRHSDHEIQGTDVQHPTAGTNTPEGAEGSTGASEAGGDDAAQHVWSDGHDPDRAKGNLGDSSADEPDAKTDAPVAGADSPVESASGKAGADSDTPGSASAGQSVGHSVDSAPGGTTADASAPGKDPMTERFGDGAASTKPDGSAPAGHPIKGNADSMLFHTEDSPRYAATKPEVWFRDEAAATAAGFAHWDREKRGKASSGSSSSGSGTSGAGADTGSARGSDSSGSDGTSYTVGTSHPGHAVTGLTGRAAESDPGASAGEAPSDPIQAHFGPGAGSPREDGSAPSAAHRIKGNADSMLFHTEDSPHYERIEAEVWFTDEEAAKKAGFKHWDHRKR